MISKGLADADVDDGTDVVFPPNCEPLPSLLEVLIEDIFDQKGKKRIKPKKRPRIRNLTILKGMESVDVIAGSAFIFIFIPRPIPETDE